MKGILRFRLWGGGGLDGLCGFWGCRLWGYRVRVGEQCCPGLLKFSMGFGVVDCAGSALGFGVYREEL